MVGNGVEIGTTPLIYTIFKNTLGRQSSRENILRKIQKLEVLLLCSFQSGCTFLECFFSLWSFVIKKSVAALTVVPGFDVFKNIGLGFFHLPFKFICVSSCFMSNFSCSIDFFRNWKIKFGTLSPAPPERMHITGFERSLIFYTSTTFISFCEYGFLKFLLFSTGVHLKVVDL